jgi:hypothetical protein
MLLLKIYSSEFVVKQRIIAPRSLEN